LSLANAGNRNGEGRELDAGKQADGSEPKSDNNAVVDDTEDDGPWYLGKAKEEYKRKRGQQDTARPREDEDPIQVRFPCGMFLVVLC
jgi:SEL1 protein